MSVITARALDAGYDRRIVVSIAELIVDAGERLAITGANGSGKTTLLKTLGGLIPPVAGAMTAPAPGPGGAVYVHPSPFLFTGTGLDNVMLGAHGRRDAAHAALDTMRAAAFSDSDVRTLSHGQRQRIALARALAAGPSLLLVDEPETGLDTEGLAAWKALVASSTPMAIVIATHRADAEMRRVLLPQPA